MSECDERSHHVLLNEVPVAAIEQNTSTESSGISAASEQDEDSPDTTNTEYSRKNNLYSYVYDIFFNRGSSRRSSERSPGYSYININPKKCCLCSIGIGFVLMFVVQEVIQWVFCTNMIVSDSRIDTKFPHEWCIKCTQFQLSPSFEKYKLRKFTQKKSSNTAELCCANEDTFGDFLSLFVKQMLREQSAEAKTCTCTPSDGGPNHTKLLVPIGHIVGEKPIKVDMQEEHRKQCQYIISVKEWNTHTTGTILRRVGYDTGQIIIIVSGWYKVYSQVYYTYQSGHPNCSIYHYIYRNTYTYDRYEDQLLFQSGKSTSRLEGAWEHTSYIGGLTELKGGDRVFVKVSHPSFVSGDSKGSYFGLHFVDS